VIESTPAQHGRKSSGYVLKYFRTFATIVTMITANLLLSTNDISVMLRQIPLLTLARMARSIGITTATAAEFIDERNSFYAEAPDSSIRIFADGGALGSNDATCDG